MIIVLFYIKFRSKKKHTTEYTYPKWRFYNQLARADPEGVGAAGDPNPPPR